MVTEQSPSRVSVECDWDSDSIPEEVVKAVGSARDIDPTELPPIAECVDPDALDHLFDGDRTSGSVMLQYAGCDVVVYAHGEIELTTSSA